jgi:hypothetical protein
MVVLLLAERDTKIHCIGKSRAVLVQCTQSRINHTVSWGVRSCQPFQNFGCERRIKK